MKKYFALAFIAALALTSCGGHTDHAKNTTDTVKTKTGKQYTCTMDPEVIKDKPGVCPKCGMQLVEKEK